MQVIAMKAQILYSDKMMFIRKLYCKVHSETIFAKLKKEELSAQTNWRKWM